MSQSELELARINLSSGKACGHDKLVDRWLKNDTIWKASKEKIRLLFEGWLNGAEIPPHLKMGRIFCLSKQETNYPEFGKIRTITILPVLTKLYELVLRQKLSSETRRLNFVPKCQLGFSSDTIGTQEHIMTIAKLIAKSRNK